KRPIGNGNATFCHLPSASSIFFVQMEFSIAKESEFTSTLPSRSELFSVRMYGLIAFFQMNDFVRDKFTTKKGEIPLYGEIISGACVSSLDLLIYRSQQFIQYCLFISVLMRKLNKSNRLVHHNLCSQILWKSLKFVYK